MKSRGRRAGPTGQACALFFATGVAFAGTPPVPPGPPLAELRQLFEKPPDDSRIMMRWWWFGPAVAKAELEREMQLMRQGGIGGFEVQAVYPVALDDADRGIRNLPFLSDEFLDALRFVAVKAADLGLRMDLTLGSGWPYGGPSVPITEAAGRLRIERVKVEAGLTRIRTPDVGAGEQRLAAFLFRTENQALVADSFREVSEADDGTVRLPAGLVGPRAVVFFISSRTGMQVKRPGVGAEGFVLDHYDRRALDHYLASVGDRLMSAFPSGRRPHAVFCDSLEVFGSDWTPDVLDEFRKRRGYDLRPNLPALVADMGAKTTAIRRDWGKTLTELLGERFLAPLRAWAKRNDTRLRLQGYGVPPATLSSNAHVDLPEGEGWHWKALSATRWASSASHLYGRPVTSSETWTWLHSPSFRATPLDMKAEADLHFLQGVNQLVGHGWPYTAPGVPYPGWRFYAAGAFDEKNPWWIVMPDLAAYLQRVSFVLRQGRPANDVALYLPNDDAWPIFVSGRVRYMLEALAERLGPDLIPRVLEAGFNFDLVDDDALRLCRVEKGTIVLGENRFRAVVLPGVEALPAATYRMLEAFARSGGVLIATRRTPSKAPGFLAREAEHGEIASLSAGLFRGPGARGRFVEDEGRDVGGALTRGLAPDVSLSPAAPEVGFVHRRTGDADVYFLANTSNLRQEAAASFRVERRHAEWWDPMTGTARAAETKAGRGSGVVVDLDLPPYGSAILVLSDEAPPATSRPVESRPLETIDLSTGWRVTFGRGQEAVTWDHLRSWTDDVETRYFSGVAAYERTLEVPEALLRPGVGVRLDFGEGRPTAVESERFEARLENPVREAALVYVNDRPAGSVWHPPYALDVTAFLRPGPNRLRVEVANLAVNHMAGRALPDYRLLNLRYGVRFEPQDMDKVAPVPAGLTGPIRLIAVTTGAP